MSATATVVALHSSSPELQGISRTVNGWGYHPGDQSWIAEVSPGRWVSIRGLADEAPNFTPADVMTEP
jgi:hypothetical protein